MNAKQPLADTRWMRLALDMAAQAVAVGEVPVGAVLVSAAGEYLAGAHNAPIATHDPSAHAEMRALRAAGLQVENYRLTGSTLYVTLEPCVMCAGAILHARVARVVYGAADPKAGAVESLYQLFDDPRFNHRIQVEAGLLADASATLLKDFFRARRARPREEA
ncbi:tRNA adenosine(34) deaminase TadA [Acidithiobacillus marinus]|uniref:tRNA-specific adenosine deaminase n=1 Tax=Acidithiobacillus marinus TaxID=187490 RepID=A0A2I1DNK1_9PROT|nr:tRNA adenosine(34) deaminase TadA [Acidithiobacillus marinus]PKY11441.1 tRNA adenosine(34) deaminase TadA [Acidithiobacillus marinus]